jgi:hypothetical protein
VGTSDADVIVKVMFISWGMFGSEFYFQYIITVKFADLLGLITEV